MISIISQYQRYLEIYLIGLKIEENSQVFVMDAHADNFDKLPNRDEAPPDIKAEDDAAFEDSWFNLKPTVTANKVCHYKSDLLNCDTLF